MKNKTQEGEPRIVRMDWRGHPLKAGLYKNEDGKRELIYEHVFQKSYLVVDLFELDRKKREWAKTFKWSQQGHPKQVSYKDIEYRDIESILRGCTKSGEFDIPDMDLVRKEFGEVSDGGIILPRGQIMEIGYLYDLDPSSGSGGPSYGLDSTLYKNLGEPNEIFFRTLLRNNQRER
ncbi:hypothetical protein HYT25_01890 [Candidatus Pacearchaeota archaeon]|nr:hypothetical protein [Candidatus Pacearchaeota archaeon]